MSKKSSIYLFWLPPVILIAEVAVFAFVDLKTAAALLLPLIMVFYWAINATWGLHRAWTKVLEQQEHPRQIFWKEVFNLSPVATVVIDDRGKIIWSNELFANIFQNSKPIKDLSNVLPEEELKKILAGDFSGEVEINDIIFQVEVKPLKRSTKLHRQDLKAIYFEDVTQVVEMARKLDDQKPVV